MDNSQKYSAELKKQRKRVNAICFYLYETLQETKLICSDSRLMEQVMTAKEDEGMSWGDRKSSYFNCTGG